MIDTSRLVSSQVSRQDQKQYFCDDCLINFTSEPKLKLQQKDCNHISTKLPTSELKLNKHRQMTPENIIKLEYFEKHLKVPFILYADFLCYLQEVYV